MLINWLLSALSLVIVANVIPGFELSGFVAALIAALVIGFVNATLGFFLKIVTFPLTIVTLGIFWLVINALMLKVAAALVPGFRRSPRHWLGEPQTHSPGAGQPDNSPERPSGNLRNLHTGELKDPLGTGLEDLKAKILRTPLAPESTFHDDPLRMLRAVRFRWKLGFEPYKGLYGAIKREAHRLNIISGERIRDETRRRREDWFRTPAPAVRTTCAALRFAAPARKSPA